MCRTVKPGTFLSYDTFMGKIIFAKNGQTACMEKEIADYLKGPRLYREGVALYAKFGTNRMLARRFALDESESTKEIMIEELRKLSGLSMAEMSALPRMAMTAHLSVTSLPDAQAMKPVSPDIQKKLRFRERFDFLAEPDCPNVLKLIVNDMFAALDRYRANHKKLVETADGNMMPMEASAVVDDYLFNRMAWRELEHYRTTRQLLGDLEDVRRVMNEDDPVSLSDLDLQKKLHSARTNLNKARKAVEIATAESDRDSAAMRVAVWTDKLDRFKAEVERRKKK